MNRLLPVRTALPLVLLLALSTTARAAEAPPPGRTLESGWSTEGFVDPGFEAERAQIAFDDQGQAISVWSGRTSVNDPLQMHWSRLTGTAWSPATTLFAATPATERLPQVSRAPDGTVWLAWLRDNNRLGGGAFRGPSLLASRLVAGTWSAPETVAVEVPLLDEAAPEVEFSILAVSRDQAWLAWGIAPDGDPFSLDRDLVYSVHSAAGWSLTQPLWSGGLAETRPVLVETTDGSPAVFFTFKNAPSLMQALRWTGVGGWSSLPDNLTANAFFSFSAAPDTNGAVRLVAIVRESPDGTLLEDHIRELTWNATGFHPGPLLNSAPVVQGGTSDPPDWSNVAIASGHACPRCAGPANDLVFRALWVDYSQTGAPRVYSSLRTAAGYQPYELVGTSYETVLAFPSAVHDVAADRWYATWTAPPAFGSVSRAKFSFTQEFAGDLGIGASYVSPDTVRVTLVCSGDATGRALRLYRLNWPPGQGSPPFSPPLPAAAVPLPGNPFTGPCPLVVDDFPGPGRWFYYAELEAAGSFPARSARSFNPAIVPAPDGGGGDVTRTALLTPRPQPAVGSVSLPFDLAAPGSVALVIRDLVGRFVRRFDLGERPAGEYRFSTAPTWTGQREDGSGVPPGIYFLTMLVDGRPTGPPVRIVLVPAHL
ncbi:MAG: FlgD immunoglobulin-like domain containing protein [Candidatus Eisenbacteria bacterium]